MGVQTFEATGFLYFGSIRRWLKKLPNRIGFLIINLVLRPFLLRWLVKVERLFVVYPERESFADAFTFKWMRNRYMKNTPWIGGLYRQNGKWGIMAVIYILPNEFTEERLSIAYSNIEKLRQKIGAKEISCAGTMPGKMKAFGIRENTLETQITAVSVAKAVQQLRQDHLVILLGGNGHTGRLVNQELQKNGVPVVVVDLPKDAYGKVNYQDWPNRIGGSPFLLLNLIGGKDLQHYLPLMRRGDLLLNEAYPAPCREVAEKFRDKGIKGFHMVGVKPTFCFPSFPGEYRGGVPCCGAILDDSLEVVIRDLLN